MGIDQCKHTHTHTRTGENIIKKSLARVAKKRFEKDPADQQTAKSEKFINDTLGHIAMSTDAMDAVKSSDLVIEAIVENLGVKRQLFRDLDRCAPEHTIFTSNTSSLPIAEIASSTGRQDRFGGLHFFNPVPQMKLVEVVETDALSEQSLQALVEFSRQLKKAPVKCKDTPGYVASVVSFVFQTHG
jgi:3-hydroxyacyl-CoA dehydrogenase